MRRLALALLAFPGTAHGQGAWPDESPFATTQIKGWQAKAWTYAASGRANLPIVSNIVCTIQTNGLQVTLDRTGFVGVDPRGIGSIDGSGGEEQFGTLQVRAIQLEGAAYEAKAVATNYLPWRFTDVEYPREKNDDIILSVFRGYLAIRQHAEDPWLPMSTLLDRLLNAREIDIAYLDPSTKDRKKAQLLHFRVSLAGLSTALNWCQAQFVSERAYRTKP